MPPKSFLVAHGLINLIGVLGFLIGYFLSIQMLTIICGSLLVLDDVFSIFTGNLNPIFPILFACILAYFITPFYIGIFWASAVFAIQDVPISITKVFNPQKIIDRINSNI